MTMVRAFQQRLAGTIGGHRALLATLLVAFLVVGCGVRFMYRQLDWLIPWYVYDYVDLQGQQRSLLEQRLMTQLDWHCRTQLPIYSVWLKTLAEDPRSALRRPALDRHYREMIGYWETLAERFSPDLAEVLATASDDQVTELFDSLEARNQRSIERYVTPGPEKRHRKRVDRMGRQLRRWVGPLSDDQQQAIADWSRDLQPIAEQWIAARRHWQKQLYEVLQMRADQQALELGLRRLLVEPRHLWTDDFRALAERNEEITLQFLSTFAESLQPQQISHLSAELQALAEDFDALSCA